MSTDAKREANRRYLASMREIKLRMRESTKDEIFKAAEAAGMSVQAFVLAAVDNEIARREQARESK